MFVLTLTTLLVVPTAAHAAVLFEDGFESGDTSAWTAPVGLSVEAGDTLTGSYAARASTAGGVSYAKQAIQGVVDLHGSMGFKILSQGSNPLNLLRYQANGGGQALVTAFVNANGKLMLRNDVSGTNSWSPTDVSPASWHVLEMRLVIGESGDQVEVWLDGAKVERLSLSADLGSGPIDQVIVGDSVAGRTSDVLLDDITLISPDAPGPPTGTPGDDTIVCDAPCTVDAGAGNDTVTCRAACTVMGGPGDDTLIGSDDEDTLHGQAGADRLIGGGADDVLDGGDGRDTVDYSTAPGPVTVDLGASTATGDGVDSLASIEDAVGSPAGDTLTGDWSSNRLEGGQGADVLEGGSGSDRLVGGAGPDVIVGGPGFDTVDYSAETSGVVVSIGDGAANDGLPGEGDRVDATIESVVGGAGNDHLVGDASAELLDGGPGDDLLQGSEGDDELRGGEGNDTLQGGANDDLLQGGEGDDLEQGGGFNDVFIPNARVSYRQDAGLPIADGGTVASELTITGSPSVIYDVNARIDVEHGSTQQLHITLVSPAGTRNVLSANRGNGTPFRGTVFDSEALHNIRNSPGRPFEGRFHPDGSMEQYDSELADGVWALEIADTTAGTTGVLNGWSLDITFANASADGNDVLEGQGGTRDLVDFFGRTEPITVTMAGGADDGQAGESDNIGNDAGDIEDLYGGAAGDTITGTDGVNEIRGMIGPDAIYGLGGADTIRGRQGADLIDGGAGDDTLNPGDGDDTVVGGPGSDWLIYTGASAGVTVSLTSGTSSGGAGADEFSGMENIAGSDFSDTLVGDAGKNFLDGKSGDDQLYGMGGNDSLEGGEGSDHIDGGAGGDWVRYTSAASGVTVDLAAGTASGGDGSDSIVDVESIVGSRHADTLTGWDLWNVIHGMGGDDTLFGLGGNDKLDGGPGNDSADGGDGVDACTNVASAVNCE